MPRLTPDQSFYPSPAMAMAAEPEKLAYVAMLNPDPQQPDAMAVVDLDTGSATYGRQIDRVAMPGAGDELHHFGWNACSSCLCPSSPHPHMERRYLIVPGMRSSNIHILDTKPDARKPRLVRTIDGKEIAKRTGYSRPHTAHCGPDGIYVNALGNADGDAPGGIFVLDAETFDVRGRWEADRGPQALSYDFWWHLGHDTMITSEWGTPNMVEAGVNPELLLGGKYGHALHVWDLRRRTHQQMLDLGPEQQMVLELRPAHNPSETYGFVGVVTSLKDLSSSIWLWYREGNNGSSQWKIRKVIEIPAQPADPQQLPDLLKGFGAVPPLVTDINLSLDDRFLYVSCWGTGEFQQYDVSDPFNPILTGSVEIGGIVKRTPHPKDPQRRLNGGPQMVEVSRDGRRVYVTNSLYRTWDEQFYPDGIRGWMVKLDAKPDGGMALDPGFVLETDGLRPHQVRLQGGERLLGLVLLRMRPVMDMTSFISSSSSAGLLALGAFHGINPGMGWLFAVALGLQERRRTAVWGAMLPLALGHAAAIAVTVVVALIAGAVVPLPVLQWGVAGVLLASGIRRFFRHGHPRWVGMRVGPADLTLWSFLMASAHGAGLMVVPLVLSGAAMQHCMLHGMDSGGAWSVVWATLIHSAGYLSATALLAVVVFEKLGVGVLRKAWINLDVIWAGALIATGVVAAL